MMKFVEIIVNMNIAEVILIYLYYESLDNNII